MSANGVWTGEILGPYGWENSGVYILEDGRIIGGSNRHYSAGRYSFAGDRYEARVTVYYYGPPRSVFGEKSERFDIEVTGKLKDDVITAEVIRPDKPQYNLEYRMTKRMDLPAA